MTSERIGGRSGERHRERFAESALIIQSSSVIFVFRFRLCFSSSFFVRHPDPLSPCVPRIPPGKRPRGPTSRRERIAASPSPHYSRAFPRWLLTVPLGPAVISTPPPPAPQIG